MKKQILALTILALHSTQSFAVAYQVRENIHGQTVLIPQQMEGAGNSTETVLIQVGKGHPPIVMKLPAGCASLPVVVETSQERTVTTGVRERTGVWSSSSRSNYLSVEGRETHTAESNFKMPFVNKSDVKKDEVEGRIVLADSQTKAGGKYDEVERTNQDKDVKTQKYLHFPCNQ